MPQCASAPNEWAIRSLCNMVGRYAAASAGALLVEYWRTLLVAFLITLDSSANWHCQLELPTGTHKCPFKVLNFAPIATYSFKQRHQAQSCRCQASYSSRIGHLLTACPQGTQLLGMQCQLACTLSRSCCPLAPPQASPSQRH